MRWVSRVPLAMLGIVRWIWNWIWPSDSPIWFGLKLTEVRAAAAFVCALCLGAGIADSSNDHSHHMLTYMLWYGASGTLLLVVIVTTAVIVRRRSATALPAAPLLAPTTSTFHGGALGGDAQLRIRSSADHLIQDTVIGDHVRLDAEHHPGRHNPTERADLTDLDSRHDPSEEQAP